MVHLRATVEASRRQEVDDRGVEFQRFRVREFVVEPRHGSRIRTLSRNGAPSSSLLNCSFLALAPSSPTCFSGALKIPSVHCSLEAVRWQRGTPRGTHAVVHQSPSEKSAHADLRVIHALLSRGLSRKNCGASSLAAHANMNVAKVSADSHHPCMSAVAAWMDGGSTSFSTASIIPVKPQPCQTTTGLGKLVESGNDPRS